MPEPLRAVPSAEPDPDSPEAVLSALRAALAAHDIVLPSLELDPVMSAWQGGRPLVRLGNCPLETARALTQALASRSQQ